MNAPLPPPPNEMLLEGPPPRATWPWWEAAIAVLLAWLAGGFAALPLIALLRPAGGPIGADGLLTATVANTVTIFALVMWLRGMHPGWERIIGWPRRDGVIRELAAGAGLGILVRLASVLVASVVVTVLRGASDRSVQLPEQVSTDLAGWGLVIFVIFALFAAPMLEEFVFRGLLFRSIADRNGFWAGALVSAVAFGAYHLLTPGDSLDVLALGVTHVGTGLGLAWIYWRRRNLLASIAGHAAFNLIGVVSIIGGWEF
jgi:membrane protease YdiL (CAAX protease family)